MSHDQTPIINYMLLEMLSQVGWDFGNDIQWNEEDHGSFKLLAEDSDE